MTIIGIDPGTATTGFGVIQKLKVKSVKCKVEYGVLSYGAITTSPSMPSEERLEKIYREISKLLKKYKPDLLVIEKVFFFKNLKTALPVSEARGVILLAGANAKAEIKELTPLEIKMGICGYGRAKKPQVQRMVQEILNIKEKIKPDDAADALAAALCGSRLVK